MHRMKIDRGSLGWLALIWLALAAPGAAQNPNPSVFGFRGEVLTETASQGDKLARLAEAIPADKYTWRPAPGVRSIAEVFLHISFANYNLPKLIGVSVPAGIDLAKLEKSTTDKAKIIPILKESFAHLQQGLKDMPETDLEKPLDLFGQKTTERGLLLIMTRHISEHLGQSIAYARINGVVPPWTEDQQRQRQAPAKPKQ